MSAPRRDEVNLVLTINAQQSGNTLRDLNKQAASLRRALERIPVDDPEFDRLAKELQEVNKRITETKDKMKPLNEELGHAATSIKAMEMRTKELRDALNRLDPKSADFDRLNAELIETTKHLDAAKNKLKPISDALDDARQKTGFFGRVLETAVGVFGGLTLENAVGRLVDYGKQLFNIGVSQDFFAQKTKTVFGESEVIVIAAAEKMAHALGFTRREFIDAATAAGDLLAPMGFTQRQAADLSVELTKQAGVLAQWSGGKVNATQAQEILTKALLGERDALNTLGVDVKDSLIQDELKKRGLKDLSSEAKRQAEALITLDLVTKQSKAANEQFNSRQGNSVKTMAQLRARLAEVSDTLARTLVPVFAFFINLADKGLTVLIGIARTIQQLPQFWRENQVAIGLLVTGLLALNGATIAVAANTIRANVVARAAAIATSAQTAAQWLLNAAMTANPIGLVITALGALALGFKLAYERSESFRNIVTASFEAVKNVILNQVEGFKAIFDGFGEAFSGNFSKAGDAFLVGIQKLNPLAVGQQLRAGFDRGLQESKDKAALARIVREQDAAKQAALEDVRQNDKAAAEKSLSLDDQLAALKGQKAKKSAEDLAKGQKEALDASIQALELALGREELALDIQRKKGEIGEFTHQRELADIRRASYEAQLAELKKFGQEQSKEALEIQRKLLDVAAPNDSISPEIGGRGIASSVSSVKKGSERAVATTDRIDAEAGIEEQKLRDRFARQIILEGEFETAMAQNRVNAADRKLAMLTVAGQTETEIFKKTLDEKAKADADFHETQIKNEQRTKELKTAALQAGIGAAGDALQLGIDLLGKDEAARKKHAGAIKAFEIGQVSLNLASEIQGIWKNSNANPINALIPGWGTAFAVIQTALAAGRAGVQIRNIRAQKFAHGGFTGDGLPFTDETGHRPAGVVHGGEWVGPKWMVGHPQFAPVFQTLELSRLRGYAVGGNVSTTPTMTQVPQFSGGSSSAAANSAGFERAAMMFFEAVQQMPREVRARVDYLDIEDAGATLNTIRNEAAY